MRVTRLYTGRDGESHFEEIDLPLMNAGAIGSLSTPFAVKKIIFRETDGTYHYHWHNAPERQFVLILEGQVEIEIGSGEKRLFSSGDILLAEDTTGHGHISRAVNGGVRRSVFVVLES
ncbi:MAG: hypothetical protein JRD88_08600 [Deltaproteobacteria bacterium]|jgi:uncharacterized protein YjlB|nr:hypothetical protein [Deltaproteobacteria bacterium]